MYLTNEQTYELLSEEFRLDQTKDVASRINKFKTKPKGILIQDTYNNPFFPINPRPQIDTAQFDLPVVIRRFRELHSKFSSLLLPWHYMIEMIEDSYYVFNTRPTDMKFPMSNSEVKKDNWNEETKSFMNNQIFDISEAIHVCIIGDSNLDVYPKRVYEIIGRFCLVPFYRYFPEGLFQRTFLLNIGRKFNSNILLKFMRI